MELIKKIRHRVGYVWYWRVRHWWMDTPQGAHTKRILGVLGLLVFVINTIEAFIAGRDLSHNVRPQQSIIWVVVWLIVALIVAAAVVLSSNSKPAQPPEQSAKAPTTKDGRGAVRYYGTRWIDDPAQLAWKVVGRDPIYSDGGGK